MLESALQRNKFLACRTVQAEYSHALEGLKCYQTTPNPAWGEGIDWNPIPDHLREGLRRYVLDGIRPGWGLWALLADRPISQVLPLLDDIVRPQAMAITRFFYNELPSPSWGSSQKVADWIAHSGVSGLRLTRPGPESGS